MSKRITTIIITIFLCFLWVLPVSAEPSKEGLLPRLVDYGELLTDSEEDAILENLDEISERQNFDVVIVTVNTLEGKTPEAYADDFYDDNGYGMGDSNDGVLLLVSMEDRDWWMTTMGFGITAITDAGIEYISEQFLPDLSDGLYASSFDTYATLCDKFVTQAKTGEPYDEGRLPKGSVSPFWVPGSLVIGALLAFIPLGIMKGNLKSVRREDEAKSYLVQNSLNITEKKDIFLYTHVDRSARPKENKSGGGSRTHESSSGTSHGGGGGKF